ncbi:MAG: hypothetical protein IH870_05610 [Chloroflexi bacterium]|nr:hypothetical protein [Chloroflexota bacterium]
MSKKTKSDPPESIPPSQPDPDIDIVEDLSGEFQIPKEFEPLAPMLKSVIGHIKKSNAYQKQANIDLMAVSKLLRELVKTIRWLGVAMLLGVVAAVWLGFRIEHVVHEMEENVAKKEDVKAAVDMANNKPQPELVSDEDGKISIRIPVKAESTADPNTMTSSPPPPVAVEIPVQLPKGLDLKVKKRRPKKKK